MLLQNLSPLIAIACAAVGLAGCEALSPQGSHWPEWDEHNTPPANLLEMKLVDMPDSVEQSQTVKFTMEVTNTSGQDFYLFVGGNPASGNKMGYHDFLVTGEESKLFWSVFLPGTEEINGEEVKIVKPSALVGVPLKAGESITMSVEWDGKDSLHEEPLEPGRYEVTGLYEVASIEDIEGSVIIDNKVGHYTTEPKEMVIIDSE